MLKEQHQFFEYTAIIENILKDHYIVYKVVAIKMCKPYARGQSMKKYKKYLRIKKGFLQQ